MIGSPPADPGGRDRGTPGSTGERLRLIVCGEPYRGDDGAAAAAADGLPADVTDLVELIRTPALHLEMLVDLPAGVPCVLVDAVTGIEPGAVVVFPIARLAVPGHAGTPRSSHELPIDQVVALAALMRGAPPEGTFIGIGAASAGLGTALTPAVRDALPWASEVVATEVRRLVADGRAGRSAARPED